MAVIFVGDAGTIIDVTILKEDGTPQNLVSVSDIFLVFEKPNKTQIIKKKSTSGISITDAANGVIRFIAPSGFWDTPGIWQGYIKVIITPGVDVLFGTSFQFQVADNPIKDAS